MEALPLRNSFYPKNRSLEFEVLYDTNEVEREKMRWENFLSHLHFYIAHVLGKQNVVADALSRRPQVNAITIAHHKDRTLMVEEYKNDNDFATIYKKVKQGHMIPPYSIKDGFLMHGS